MMKEKNILLQHAKDITSQGGEDGITEYLFKNILNNFNIGKKLYCVDVGAWDGKHLSNTYNLCFNESWSGLLIEANTTRCSEMKSLYAGRSDVICLNILVDFEGDNSLLKILMGAEVPKNFQFLSIDVDGVDYHIWDSLDESFSPQVICIEFNPTIPNRVNFVQERDMRVYQGSSLRALTDLANRKGYELICTTTFNAFYIRKDLLVYLPEYDRSFDSLNNCSMVTDIFQTYDGELKFSGPLKLMWHRIAMNPQKLQILSKSERKYPFAPPSIDYLQPLFVALNNYEIQKNHQSLKNLLQTAYGLLAVSSLEGIVLEIIEYGVKVLVHNSDSLKYDTTNSEENVHIHELLILKDIAQVLISRADQLFLKPTEYEQAVKYYMKAYFILTVCNDKIEQTNDEMESLNFKREVIGFMYQVTSKLADILIRQNNYLEGYHWLNESQKYFGLQSRIRRDSSSNLNSNFTDSSSFMSLSNVDKFQPNLIDSEDVLTKIERRLWRKWVKPTFHN